MGTIFARLRGWLNADFILPTARTLYFVGACGALAIAAFGLIAALAFQLVVWAPVSRSVASAPPEPRHIPMSYEIVSARLRPPANIRVQVTAIREPVDRFSVIGSIVVDTSNGLDPNDGILVLGGEDASQIVMASRGRTRNTVPFTADEMLVAELNEAFQKGVGRSRKYNLRVAAKDVFGNISEPRSLTFAFDFLGLQEAQTPMQKSEEVPQLTEYQEVARAIALRADPQRTPQYFSIYKNALAVPARCGTNSDNRDFIVETQLAFDRAKEHIDSKNVYAFFAGLCDGWAAARGQERETSRRIRADHDAVVSMNLQREAAAEARRGGAWAARNVALAIAAGAIGTFLSIALLLAFLAMERHSKAMRDMLALLIEERTLKLPKQEGV